MLRLAMVSLKLKYPKFLLLFLSFLVAYVLFYGRSSSALNSFILSLGFGGALLAGIMYAYGFTAAPATAIFLIMAPHQNIYLSGMIGGVGALLADLIIFEFIRDNFQDEIQMLSKEKVVIFIHQHTPKSIKDLLLPVLAGLIIASPLPDEIGVALLASSRTISMQAFTMISLVLNTIGIFVVLLIGAGMA